MTVLCIRVNKKTECSHEASIRFSLDENGTRVATRILAVLLTFEHQATQAVAEPAGDRDGSQPQPQQHDARWFGDRCRRSEDCHLIRGEDTVGTNAIVEAKLYSPAVPGPPDICSAIQPMLW